MGSEKPIAYWSISILHHPIYLVTLLQIFVQAWDWVQLQLLKSCVIFTPIQVLRLLSEKAELENQLYLAQQQVQDLEEQFQVFIFSYEMYMEYAVIFAKKENMLACICFFKVYCLINIWTYIKFGKYTLYIVFAARKSLPWIIHCWSS